jgi:hypothetical protein
MSLLVRGEMATDHDRHQQRGGHDEPLMGVVTLCGERQ